MYIRHPFFKCIWHFITLDSSYNFILELKVSLLPSKVIALLAMVQRQLYGYYSGKTKLVIYSCMKFSIDSISYEKFQE